MQTIQFSHANGFPAPCYQYFFHFLNNFNINYVPNIGHGNYPITSNWPHLVAELIADIESKQTVPVIGVGHSLGAYITLLAAQKRPDLFSQVIIMDPPLMRPIMRLLMRISVLLGIEGKLIPPAKKAKRRRTDFNSYEEAYDYFKSKRLFKNFAPQCIKDYVQYGLKEKTNGQGLTLVFEAQKEYKVFCATPYHIKTSPLSIPATLIYSNSSEVLQPADILWLKKAFNWQTVEYDGGHLFPLEQPKETAELLLEIIK